MSNSRSRARRASRASATSRRSRRSASKRARNSPKWTGLAIASCAPAWSASATASAPPSATSTITGAPPYRGARASSRTASPKRASLAPIDRITRSGGFCSSRSSAGWGGGRGRGGGGGGGRFGDLEAAADEKPLEPVRARSGVADQEDSGLGLFGQGSEPHVRGGQGIVHGMGRQPWEAQRGRTGA